MFTHHFDIAKPLPLTDVSLMKAARNASPALTPMLIATSTADCCRYPSAGRTKNVTYSRRRYVGFFLKDSAPMRPLSIGPPARPRRYVGFRGCFVYQSTILYTTDINVSYCRP
jgi:hypothetical protein